MNLTVFEINFKRIYKVLTASSGEEGLQKLSTDKDIIVVISDMKMPGMNGLEFIKKAKEDHPDIAYFILTGFDISKEISRALENKLIYNISTSLSMPMKYPPLSRKLLQEHNITLS